jgi:hypothetical protein
VTPVRPARVTVPARTGRAVLMTMVALLTVAACGGSSNPGRAPAAAAAGGAGGVTAGPGAGARRLLDPDNEPTSPSSAQIACVVRTVVLDPTVDQIANDMAQIEDKDLRQLVMTDYLNCAYNYVLDLYMRFAPAGLTPEMKACIRSKFTQLNVNRLSEVMVEDPDAGYTGPLTIHLCQTGSKSNPLLHGTIPGMGSS